MAPLKIRVKLETIRQNPSGQRLKFQGSSARASLYSQQKRTHQKANNAFIPETHTETTRKSNVSNSFRHSIDKPVLLITVVPSHHSQRRLSFIIISKIKPDPFRHTIDTERPSNI